MDWHPPLCAVQRLEDPGDLQHDRPSFWIVHPLSAVHGVFKHIFKGCQEIAELSQYIGQQKASKVWDASTRGQFGKAATQKPWAKA